MRRGEPEACRSLKELRPEDADEQSRTPFQMICTPMHKRINAERRTTTLVRSDQAA